jgi:hypothetical protein
LSAKFRNREGVLPGISPPSPHNASPVGRRDEEEKEQSRAYPANHPTEPPVPEAYVRN